MQKSDLIFCKNEIIHNVTTRKMFNMGLKGAQMTIE